MRLIPGREPYVTPVVDPAECTDIGIHVHVRSYYYQIITTTNLFNFRYRNVYITKRKKGIHDRSTRVLHVQQISCILGT